MSSNPFLSFPPLLLTLPCCRRARAHFFRCVQLSANHQNIYLICFVRTTPLPLCMSSSSSPLLLHTTHPPPTQHTLPSSLRHVRPSSLVMTPSSLPQFTYTNCSAPCCPSSLPSPACSSSAHRLCPWSASLLPLHFPILTPHTACSAFLFCSLCPLVLLVRLLDGAILQSLVYIHPHICRSQHIIFVQYIYYLYPPLTYYHCDISLASFVVFL